MNSNSANVPFISIIIPLYNRKHFIRKTLTSVQAQTYPHWETIVIDDDSTDGSYEVVQKLAERDRRIKVLKRPREPKGAPTCRNVGAVLAEGDYLIFLDSDDLLADYCLEQRVKYVKNNPELDFLVFPLMIFKKEKYDTNILWNILSEENDLKRFLRMDAVWQTMCPIYKKDFLLNGNFFDESLPFWQDYVFHIDILFKGPSYKAFMKLPPDCFYRLHGSGISQQGLNTQDELIVKGKIYYELLLKHKSKLYKYHNEVSSTYFYLCRLLNLQSHNLSQSLELWKKYCEEFSIPRRELKTGYFLLKLEHLKKKSSFYRYFLKIVSRITLDFSKGYFRGKERTLCKVKYGK